MGLLINIDPSQKLSDVEDNGNCLIFYIKHFSQLSPVKDSVTHKVSLRDQLLRCKESCHLKDEACARQVVLPPNWQLSCKLPEGTKVHHKHRSFLVQKQSLLLQPSFPAHNHITSSVK